MAVLTNEVHKGTFYVLGANGYEKCCPFANEVYMKDGTTVESKISSLNFTYGKSDDWYYRKWDNGVLECWLTRGGTTASNGVLHSSAKFPFEFIDFPSVTASAYVAGDMTSRVGYIGSTKKDLEWYVHGYGNNVASIRLFVIGCWK